jgi:hypothetical protein
VAAGFLPIAGLSRDAHAEEDSAPSKVTAETAAVARATAAEEDDPKIEASPGDTIEIPPGRPEWTSARPDLLGKVHRIPVASGPYASDAESRRALDEALVKATREYIAEQLDSEMAGRLLGYDARTIKRRFIQPENSYHDVARYSIGWMHENFALLEFGPEFRQELDRRWTQMRATSRLAQTGLASGALLLLLGSIFGYFRLDNATRGYYTGRLQFLAAAAILAVVGAGVYFARSIHWL